MQVSKEFFALRRRPLTPFPCCAPRFANARRLRAHVHSATIQPECQARLQHLRHVGALRRRSRRLLQTRAERARGKACGSCRDSGYRAEGDAVRSLADECAAPFCSDRCYPAHAPHRRRWQRTARSRRAAEPHEAAMLPSDEYLFMGWVAQPLGSGALPGDEAESSVRLWPSRCRSLTRPRGCTEFCARPWAWPMHAHVAASCSVYLGADFVLLVWQSSHLPVTYMERHTHRAAAGARGGGGHTICEREMTRAHTAPHWSLTRAVQGRGRRGRMSQQSYSLNKLLLPKFTKRLFTVY